MSEEREKCGEMDGECEEGHGNAADEGQGEEWRPSAGTRIWTKANAVEILYRLGKEFQSHSPKQCVCLELLSCQSRGSSNE